MDSKEILKNIGWEERPNEKGHCLVRNGKTILFTKQPYSLSQIESYETDLSTEEERDLLAEIGRYLLAQS